MKALYKPRKQKRRMKSPRDPRSTGVGSCRTPFCIDAPLGPGPIVTPDITSNIAVSICNTKT